MLSQAKAAPPEDAMTQKRRRREFRAQWRMGFVVGLTAAIALPQVNRR